MIRVDIEPELLKWARERAGFETDALAHRFPKLAAWQQGTVKPTLRQIEDFAKEYVAAVPDDWKVRSNAALQIVTYFKQARGNLDGITSAIGRLLR